MNFTGPEHAIRFAYNMTQREIIARPNLTGERGNGQGLGPHDLHAQAAMILAAFSRAPEHLRDAVNVMLAPRKSRAFIDGVARVAYRLHPTLSAHGDLTQVAKALGSLRGGSIRSLGASTGLSFRAARELRIATSRAHGDLYLRGVAWLETEMGSFSSQ